MGQAERPQVILWHGGGAFCGERRGCPSPVTLHFLKKPRPERQGMQLPDSPRKPQERGIRGEAGWPWPLPSLTQIQRSSSSSEAEGEKLGGALFSVHSLAQRLPTRCPLLSRQAAFQREKGRGGDDKGTRPAAQQSSSWRGWTGTLWAKCQARILLRFPKNQPRNANIQLK